MRRRRSISRRIRIRIEMKRNFKEEWNTFSTIQTLIIVLDLQLYNGFTTFPNDDDFLCCLFRTHLFTYSVCR